jgi:hypothetical protein
MSNKPRTGFLATLVKNRLLQRERLKRPLSDRASRNCYNSVKQRSIPIYLASPYRHPVFIHSINNLSRPRLQATVRRSFQTDSEMHLASIQELASLAEYPALYQCGQHRSAGSWTFLVASSPKVLVIARRLADHSKLRTCAR